MAALGGALVFGALPRVTRRVGRVRCFHTNSMLGASMLLALGMVILATTRPFEGCVICLPVAAVFLHWLLSQRGRPLRYALWHAVAPCVVILGVAAAITLFYQYRVTGHALESPYDVAIQQIHVSRPFVFQKPMPTPHYDHLEMRLVYVHYAAQTANKMHDPYGFLETLKDRISWYWQFFVGPLMTLPLFASLMVLRDRRLRLVWIAVILLAVAVLIENWIQVHYLAPGFCLFVLLLLQGARRVKALHLGRYAAGARLVRALPVVCVLLLGLRIFAFAETDDVVGTHWPPNWAYSTPRIYDRERIEDSLNATQGQHLVLVRYRYPFHSYHRELVFNGADLAGSKILWARSMDARQNCTFVQAYRERKLWIVDQWGDVTKFLPATEAQICDPLSPIYEANKPIEYYLKRASAAAGRGADQTSRADQTSSHATVHHAHFDE